jgi:hypothetical protein
MRHAFVSRRRVAVTNSTKSWTRIWRSAGRRVDRRANHAGLRRACRCVADRRASLAGRGSSRAARAGIRRVDDAMRTRNCRRRSNVKAAASRLACRSNETRMVGERMGHSTPGDGTDRIVAVDDGDTDHTCAVAGVGLYFWTREVVAFLEN